MILLWISILELHFIYRRRPPNFVWIRSLLRKLLCPREKSTYVQPDNQTDRKTERQTDRQTENIFFASFEF